MSRFTREWRDIGAVDELRVGPVVVYAALGACAIGVLSAGGHLVVVENVTYEDEADTDQDARVRAEAQLSNFCHEILVALGDA